jgi:tRNA-dihydrouridine synthase A
MIGRQAYHSPWLLTELEREFGAAGPVVPQSRSAVVLAMLPYVEQQLCNGAKLKHISRHLLGLFAGQPGARAWRRYLSEHAHRPGAGADVLEAALKRLPVAA